MIILGVILLIIGVIAKIAILWSIGIILVVVGLIRLCLARWAVPSAGDDTTTEFHTSRRRGPSVRQAGRATSAADLDACPRAFRWSHLGRVCHAVLGGRPGFLGSTMCSTLTIQVVTDGAVGRFEL